MKKYIYINYFSDSNLKRREEYLTCVRNNLALDFITGLIIFLENPAHRADLPENPKITFVDLPRRMEFIDCLRHAQSTLDPGSIIIIANLDIYLENSDAWRNIDKNFFDQGYPHKTMVSQRHNVNEDGSTWIEENDWRKGNFCDVWILRTPVDTKLMEENLAFCVGGAPQCDNLMMYLMSKYYHVFYWGSKYKVFHLDNCRKANKKSGMIFTSATDWRPSKRRNEHIDIPAYQDWGKLLVDQTQPEYRGTWTQQTR